MLNDAFFSLVHKDCNRDELCVRARRKGDIEKVFPNAKVKKTPTSDYLFRANVKRIDVVKAMTGEINRITYPNFKDSVRDKKLHLAYSRLWWNMSNQDPLTFSRK